MTVSKIRKRIYPKSRYTARYLEYKRKWKDALHYSNYGPKELKQVDEMEHADISKGLFDIINARAYFQARYKMTGREKFKKLADKAKKAFESKVKK